MEFCQSSEFINLGNYMQVYSPQEGMASCLPSSDIIDGKKVLIDDDNIVYTNIHNPLIIGKMNKEGKIESI